MIQNCKIWQCADRGRLVGETSLHMFAKDAGITVGGHREDELVLPQPADDAGRALITRKFPQLVTREKHWIGIPINVELASWYTKLNTTEVFIWSTPMRYL